MAKDYQVVVTCVFTSESGVFPPPAEMARKIVDAFLAVEPRLWSFSYPVEVVTAKPKDPRWWAGLTPPFKAYVQPNMEKRIVCFPSELSNTVSGFKQFNYAMDVSQISKNGLRFKVSTADPKTGTPELWCLAYQTQEKPE
jgi:hypothetical protein